MAALVALVVKPNHDSDNKGMGGDGEGGNGGRGGCGGGGGGGPSIGVLGAGMASLREENATFEISRGGDGGPSCEQSGGERGLTADKQGVEPIDDGPG